MTCVHVDQQLHVDKLDPGDVHVGRTSRQLQIA